MKRRVENSERSKQLAGNLHTLERDITPPPRQKLRNRRSLPTSAAVEAGQAHVDDKVGFFANKLLGFTRPIASSTLHIPFDEWLDLYQRNEHSGGKHYVIHQHDHPVAGTHYDLRLQCNATSSISFAIMYGLPGNPNSRRLNRNATETRVHCLWNHLIETASYSTGTMLIWDTGEYNILPYHEQLKPTQSDSESQQEKTQESPWEHLTETQKLHHAFAQRKIRVRLHGTRLPQSYTLSIRLSKSNNTTSQPNPPKSKRRRRDPSIRDQDLRFGIETSESEREEAAPGITPRSLKSLHRTASPPEKRRQAASGEELEVIRKSNAYPGAVNDISSIHQRCWYLSMDRPKSGFVLQNGKDGRSWKRSKAADGTLEGFEPFTVLGRDAERSIVTGRLARDILQDEGVNGYVPRGLWRPVIE